MTTPASSLDAITDIMKLVGMSRVDLGVASMPVFTLRRWTRRAVCGRAKVGASGAGWWVLRARQGRDITGARRVGVTLVASHASPRFRPLAVGMAGQSLHNLVRCEPVPQSQTPDRRDRGQIVVGKVL